jgi:DNA polymerase-3 subunit gamma/tau
MAYQVLARKWRPQRFEELIGQEHITQALSHALSSKRLHHAYLFTGTRGVGKTTIARIIAKCLNCEVGISATPCGECQICLALDAGRFMDLLEIDAASKTKVEDTRELLENVMYAPTQGRYKIYLIDEVHMLSGHSFNALLKTLEEPPAHVIFLLATTDPQKLPITVLSRCLQFQLKALSPELLAPHLAHILTQENIAFEAAALDLLAQAAKGSARDALSLLDQAIASGGGAVARATVTDMLGLQGQQLILPLAQQILSQQVAPALTLSRQLAEIAADFDYILEQLIHLFHDLSIKQLAPDFVINNPIVSEQELTQLAQSCDASDLQLFYQIALLAKRDLALAPSSMVGFEMALLRMMVFKVETTTAALKHTNTQITSPISTTSVVNTVEPIKSTVVTTPPWQTEAAILKPTAAAAPPTIVNKENQTWHEFLPQLGLSAFSKALSEHLHFERKETNHYYFSLEQNHAPMLQEKHRLRIQQALSDYFARPIGISVQIGRTQKSQASAVQNKSDQKQNQQNQSMTAFKQDANLQKILNQFDAKIIDETLNIN